jgi:diaminopimelate epimerase
MTEGRAFAKGNGTGNDFVLLPDPEGDLDLTAAQVRAVCDRRFGIGGDGVLRVVRTEVAGDDVQQLAGGAEWFMDYRNADGSVAEMCGNGARVFARYLVQEGLVEAGAGVIGTRAGVLAVDVPHAFDGDVTIAMGTATTPLLRALPQVVVGERSWPATGVLCPNPHAVVFVDDLAEAGDLLAAPQVVPAAVFPDGVNIEFVVRHEPGHVRMRVHERGVGETPCGTGRSRWRGRPSPRRGRRCGRRRGCPEARPRCRSATGSMSPRHGARGRAPRRAPRPRGPLPRWPPAGSRPRWWASSPDPPLGPRCHGRRTPPPPPFAGMI